MPYIPPIQNLPDNLYTRGAVVSTLPQYFNYIMQAKARREAKQQAVDNYYQDLSKNLTSTGMAANDIPDFMDKVNNWREFVVQNRQILANPQNPDYAKVATRAGYLYNDAQGHSDMSKNKVKQLADMREFIKPDHPLTDASLQMIDNATKPISQGYQPPNYSLIAYNPKADPTTVDDWNKWREYGTKGLTMSEGQPAIVVDPKTKSKVVTTKSFYQPNQLNEIATRYETLYQQDPKFMKEVDAAMQDENTATQANARFKEIYGHDLSIQHPEEFAVALMMPQTEKTNTQPYNFSPTTIKITNQAAAQEAPQSLDNYISQLQANASPREYKYANGKTETHYEIQPSPQLSNMFAAKSGTQTLYPDQIQFLPNGDVLPIYYKNMVDKQGNTVPALIDGKASVDQSLSKPVSQGEFRIRLAKEMFGEKGLMNVMKTDQQQKNNLPNNQPPKVKKYKGLDKNGNPIFE